MPDLEQKDFPDEQKDFLIEKIKEKPVNKKKLIRRTIITVSMAVIFGLVACVTFLVLEPVISNWLYPEEEPEIQTVEFPEDKEEMSPEEMLAENLPTESLEPTPVPTPEPTQGPSPEGGEETEVQLGEEQIQDILSQVTFDLDHYKELYAALHEYGNELSRYIVTVTAVTSNIDWFNSVQERENQCSGVIISENGMELLILSDYSAIRSAERLRLTFYDESQVEAQLKQYNEATNLAVLSVPLEALSDEVGGSREDAQEDPEGQTETGQEDAESQGAESQGQEGLEGQGAPGGDAPDGQGTGSQGVQGPESPANTEPLEEEGLPIVKFGYSNSKSLVGTPVIAIGSPVGTSNSISYGMITASSTTVSAPDRNYRILLTDISGSQSASGALFDLQGRMVGIITNHRTGSDMRNLITAYGITDLQKTVEKMSNGALIAYLGIRGADVPREANQELGIPFGAYVEEFDMDSPAMLAGIQRGDVITAIGEKGISSFAEYSKVLMDLEPGETVEVTVMRQAQEEYREMKFNIELGGVR